jgi:hypothetical protein
MTAPRRRRKASPPPPPLEVSTAALEAFIGASIIDPARASAAMKRATAAAEAFTGQPIPDPCPHALRHGVLLYASQLLILPDNSPAAEPSLIVRAMWRNHVSAPAG